MISFSLNQEFDELVKVTVTEKQQILNYNNSNNNNNIENENKSDMSDLSAKGPDFFLDNKLSNKRSERKYTTTRIKSRTFLSNISYVGINKEDFYNENVIFDIYLLVTKNLNTFSLDRKLNGPNKHEIIYVTWKECIPATFYKFICKDENFIYLNGKNVLQPKVSEIITNFLKENEKKLRVVEKQFVSVSEHFSVRLFKCLSWNILCNGKKRFWPQEHCF